MGNQSQSITGAEALSMLENDASSELKRVRQLVEEAVEFDIRAYLRSIGAGEPMPNVLTGLSAAAIAGGQWGFANLVNRLNVADLKTKDLDFSANEILSLVYRHTSILNNVRLKISAVQSIVKTFVGKSSTQGNKAGFEQILNFRISSLSTLIEWGEDTEELFQKQASSTGQVSNRSISTYSKLWKSYLDERISPRLGIKLTSDKTDLISERIKPLIGYKEPTINQIKKLLTNPLKKSDFVTIHQQASNLHKYEKLVTNKKNLGGRALKISYNLSGIDPDLIQPALNSVRGQIMIDPKQSKLLVDMSNESSQLIIEIEKPIKEDIDTLKIQLAALSSTL